jgi:hypothetical protein
MSIVGGTLRVDSRPGAGSTVRAEVPLAGAGLDAGAGTMQAVASNSGQAAPLAAAEAGDG